MAGAQRPRIFRPTGGRSQTPLLQTSTAPAPLASHKRDDDADSRGRRQQSPPRDRTAEPLQDEPVTPVTPYSALRPTFSRRSTMRSRSPATNARLAARQRYTYAAFFLLVSLASFTAQTELAAYVQHDLGWDKAYAMLYLTHGSWVLLWPAMLAVLRLQKRATPWHQFWRRHLWLLRTTAQMVETRSHEVPPRPLARSPVPYMLRTTALVTCALTVAGASWYVAVNKTTPADLTAIYNCSAFFAYAFSVPLLKERLRLDKSLAVAVAIVGVMVVAYGDGGGRRDPSPPASAPGSAPAPPSAPDLDGSTRFLGNVVIGLGSVLYGLYEVLYKRLACPPDGTSPGRGVTFAMTFGSLIGAFTLLVLWIPIPVLHLLGWETFELPRGRTAALLWLSVLMNACFSGSFLTLISLTSPVLSSVAALLTIFVVALVDWLWTGVPLGPAPLLGGCLILLAFLLLAWSTWREMTADADPAAHVDLSDGEADADDAEARLLLTAGPGSDDDRHGKD